MRPLQELVIGSAIFMAIDRVVRIISSRIVEKGESAKTSLRIELLILVLCMLIAWKVL